MSLVVTVGEAARTLKLSKLEVVQLADELRVGRRFGRAVLFDEEELQVLRDALLDTREEDNEDADDAENEDDRSSEE